MSSTDTLTPAAVPKWSKIVYWGATGLFSAMMLSSAVMYFTAPEMAANFQRMGFPDFFRVELGAAKILGVIALLAPGLDRLREWAYAGFAITVVSAFILHVTMGDPLSAVLAPVIALALLLASYQGFRRGVRG